MTDKNEEKTLVAANVRQEASEIVQDEALSEQKAGLSPQDELEAIRQEAAEYKDKYLRTAAELENTRKRLERHYAEQLEEEKKRFLRIFLTVADNLERALTYSGDGLREGVQLTYQELQRLLSQEGVEPIEAIGKPFDPYYHEAVDTVDGDQDQETVVEERRKGYLYRGELLRPARVKVAIPLSH
jgi:molecular chaperone GrpE